MLQICSYRVRIRIAAFEDKIENREQGRLKIKKVLGKESRERN
jgi:hypothetical protein